MNHYLIDGYNLLYALPKIPSGSWQQKREALLLLLQTRRPQGKNRVTVVFDSRQGMGDRSQDRDIAVVFTAGQTADDRIAELVREAKHPREIVVVSNDRGVQMLVRGTGARWMKTREFLQQAHAASRSPPSPTAPADLDGITEEFKKKWLDEQR